MKLKHIVWLATAVASFAAHGAAPASVPYPDGYRAWRHVKSMVIQPGHPLYESFGGIHHLYANAKALRGYRQGRFPDGSVIVFDLLEAKSGGGALVEGERKVLGVMYKDGRRFKATGGWGFEGFAQGDRNRPVVGANADAACYQCHTQQKDADFVFSRLRD